MARFRELPDALELPQFNSSGNPLTAPPQNLTFPPHGTPTHSVSPNRTAGHEHLPVAVPIAIATYFNAPPPPNPCLPDTGAPLTPAPPVAFSPHPSPPSATPSQPSTDAPSTKRANGGPPPIQGLPIQGLPIQGPHLSQGFHVHGPPTVPPIVPGAPPNISLAVQVAPSEMARGVTTTATTSEANSESESDVESDPQVSLQEWLSRALVAAPPWLVSLIVHMLGLVLLAFFVWVAPRADELLLNAMFAESLGMQLDDPTLALSNDDSLIDDPALVTDMTAVEDPLAAPQAELTLSHDGSLASSAEPTPQIGLALSGREPGMKKALLAAYGGNQITELAVARALAWLAAQQRSNGTWSLKGPYTDGADAENKLAATSMALLAFQGAGYTHEVTHPTLDEKGNKQEVDYRRVVRRGWDAMLKWQDDDGNFWKKGEVAMSHQRLYAQAQATIAICEFYGMTKDESFRRPAQKAVNYAVEIQDTLGGWRYEPGSDSDTSVTGWFVMALQSAKMAGLSVPTDVFDKISGYLDSVTDDGGSRYQYTPTRNQSSNEAMTAEALLCRQYLGWHRDDPRLVRGVDYIANHPVDWGDPNTYYWYYATQVLHHMEGDHWVRWNKVMAREIPRKQVEKGKQKGSWSPDGDAWGHVGGRLYMTCLCTYMLEVYYRHLPIYSQIY